MKGVIFTSLLSMIEDNFGYEVVDQILLEENLTSEGIYTSIGTYEFSELQQIIKSLALKTKIPQIELIESFGKYLFSKLAHNHKAMLSEHKNFFSLLESVDSAIHRDVKKIYPEAMLPKFKTLYKEENTLVLKYSSPRGLAVLALGLMKGAALHYSEQIEIKMLNISEDHTSAEFELKKI